jgi:hypothetical protein
MLECIMPAASNQLLYHPRKQQAQMLPSWLMLPRETAESSSAQRDPSHYTLLQPTDTSSYSRSRQQTAARLMQ